MRLDEGFWRMERREMYLMGKDVSPPPKDQLTADISTGHKLWSIP